MPNEDEEITMRIIDLPGYLLWSNRIQDADPAIIAHLDSASITLSRKELGEINDEFFDSMLADLRGELGLD